MKKFGRPLRLGKIRGIGFEIHYTWFPALLFVTLSLGIAYAEIYPHWSSLTRWLAALLSALLLFASVLAHELAHSLVALKHDVPVKSITLFLFGGVAQITQEASSPGAEFRIAIAGPACSFGLAVFLGILWFLSRGPAEFIAGVAGYLALINLMLVGFNLAPGFPLDGGRILRSLIWSRTGDYDLATQIALRGGKAFSYLLIAGGIGGTIVLSWTGQGFWVGGLWLALVGWFLYTAVRGSTQGAKIRQGLRKLTVRSIMLPLNFASFPWPTGIGNQIRPDDDLLSALEKMEQVKADQLTVVEGGKVVGLLRREDLTRLVRWLKKSG